MQWSSPCFAKNVASANYNVDKTGIDITIESSQPVEGKVTKGMKTCEDLYMHITTSVVDWGTGISPVKVGPTTTKVTLPLPSDISAAETWDIENKGVRIMRYVNSRAESISNLITTVETFVPEELPNVPEKFAKLNVDFLNKYVGLNVQPRDPALNRVPDESEIKSGDSFYLMRFDGLNPLLAWAMGSTTGHVTTALWIDGQLYVCESTINGAYWPTDYIQKTPYRTWISQVQAADFQVVYVKLNDDARKNFNESAAIEWFNANEGYDYGFKTLIWAWLDTTTSNFPCLPSDFSSNCMQWQLLEPLIAYVDRLIPEAGDMLWNAGLSKRLNTADGALRTSELYQEAARQGMATNEVITIPEQDTWMYNTTRYDQPAVGRSMVCCVYVCSSWKAAGVFGSLADSINCAEQTNWDDYVLTIHANSYEQIVGTYSLDLNNFHSKDPYAHMAEKCPSLPPTYDKPADC